MDKIIKIGTRKSKLALIQTELFISALKAKHPNIQTKIVEVSTKADASQKDKVTVDGKTQDRALSDLGGKRLWTREFEDQLLDGRIDCAVHSMKDVETTFPEGLTIGCYLPREDARDAFFSEKAERLVDLPQGAVLGTASPRRGAIAKSIRPDLQIQVFRGNVGTRLQKLKDGVVDATLLAAAGLKRLGMFDLAQEILEPEVFLPAASQGAVGIEVRESDTELLALLQSIHCQTTELQCTAERAFLDVMDGSCKTPLAAYMTVPDTDGNAVLEALVAKPDGSEVKRGRYEGRITSIQDAVNLGTRAGEDLKSQIPADFLAECAA